MARLTLTNRSGDTRTFEVPEGMNEEQLIAGGLEQPGVREIITEKAPKVEEPPLKDSPKVASERAQEEGIGKRLSAPVDYMRENWTPPVSRGIEMTLGQIIPEAAGETRKNISDFLARAVVPQSGAQAGMEAATLPMMATPMGALGRTALMTLGSGLGALVSGEDPIRASVEGLGGAVLGETANKLGRMGVQAGARNIQTRADVGRVGKALEDVAPELVPEGVNTGRVGRFFQSGPKAITSLQHYYPPEMPGGMNFASPAGEAASKTYQGQMKLALAQLPPGFTVSSDALDKAFQRTGMQFKDINPIMPPSNPGLLGPNGKPLPYNPGPIQYKVEDALELLDRVGRGGVNPATGQPYNTIPAGEMRRIREQVLNDIASQANSVGTKGPVGAGDLIKHAKSEYGAKMAIERLMTDPRIMEQGWNPDAIQKVMVEHLGDLQTHLTDEQLKILERSIFHSKGTPITAQKYDVRGALRGAPVGGLSGMRGRMSTILPVLPHRAGTQFGRGTIPTLLDLNTVEGLKESGLVP